MPKLRLQFPLNSLSVNGTRRKRKLHNRESLSRYDDEQTAKRADRAVI